MNTVIYCRKSTESEDRQMLSIDAQKRELMEIAKKEGLNVVAILEESMSAKAPGRPIFNELLQMIYSGKATSILSWKIDRLARNPIDGGQISWLLQQGIVERIFTFGRTYFPTDNVLMMQIELGMATQYVRDLSVNVKRGNREKLARGEWFNKAPFGYLNDKATKTIVVDEKNSYFAVRTFELYATGNYSLPAIADTLYKEGLRTAKGKKVYHSKFERIIKMRFYTGVMEHGGQLYPGKHTPLISQELFDRVEFVRNGGSKARGQNRLFPLRGLMRCASCDCMLTASLKKGHHYYYCTNGKEICVEHKSYMRENYLYTKVAELLDHLHFDDELIEIMYLAAKERIDQNKTHVTHTENTLQNELEALMARKKRLLDTYLSGGIDMETHDARAKEFENEKTILQNQAKNNPKHDDPYATLELTKKVFLDCNRATKSFLGADDAGKKKILENLLWNLRIKDKSIVEYQFKSPFNVIEKSPKTGDFSILLPD